MRKMEGTSIEAAAKKILGHLDVLESKLHALPDEIGRLKEQLRNLERRVEETAKAKQEVSGLKERLAEKELKLEAYSDLEKALLKVLGTVKTEAIREIARKEIEKTYAGAVDEDTARRLLRNEIDKTREAGAIGEKAVRAIVQEELGRIKQVESEGVMKVTGKITEIEVHEKKEAVTADKSTPRGRIALLIAKYNFMQERHNLSQFIEELANHGWTHGRKEIEEELIWYCDAGIFQRKISTGNVYWYSLVPGMNQRIRLIQE